MRKIVALSWVLGIGVATGLSLTSCGNKTSVATATEDSSASGAAAGAVGGALSGSSSNGTQAFLVTRNRSSVVTCIERALDQVTSDWIPSAWANAACPTFKSTGSDCTASGSTMWLTYDQCSFGSSSAKWNGTQAITMSTGTASCGHFPSPGASGNIIRQMVTGANSSTPSTATVTSSFGTTATIDDSTPNLGNFDEDTITAIANGAFGSQVDFNASGARSAVTVAHRIYVAGAFDHSIDGTVTITETAGASSRTISGTVTVYHNLLRVIGTATFNTVGHTDGCCFPTSGSVTTAFAAGSYKTPTTAGSKYVGKSETLTFTGCGTATYVDPTGTSTNVTLTRCF